jgi:hypothetical protein
LSPKVYSPVKIASRGWSKMWSTSSGLGTSVSMSSGSATNATTAACQMYSISSRHTRHHNVVLHVDSKRHHRQDGVEHRNGVDVRMVGREAYFLVSFAALESVFSGVANARQCIPLRGPRGPAFRRGVPVVRTVNGQQQQKAHRLPRVPSASSVTTGAVHVLALLAYSPQMARPRSQQHA